MMNCENTMRIPNKRSRDRIPASPIVFYELKSIFQLRQGFCLAYDVYMTSIYATGAIGNETLPTTPSPIRVPLAAQLVSANVTRDPEETWILQFHIVFLHLPPIKRLKLVLQG